MTKSSRGTRARGVLLALALAAASACSVQPASSPGNTDPGQSSSGGGSGGCAGTSSRAEQQPLDLYLMLDRSGSMEDGAGTVTKWEAISSALSSFVGQTMAGVSVGLQYFPSVDQYVPSGPGCAVSDYATPEVEIGALASTAARVRASMSAQTMRSGTPTAPALQGAIDHARSWARSHSGHVGIVVLATDGQPTTCNTDLAAIDAIAAAGLSASPVVRTFVIGVGSSLGNLNGIARAGGTGAAFIVETSGSLSTQFLGALNEIRWQAVRCTYAIPAAPAGQTIDPTQVNVAYRPGSGAAIVKLGQVASATECGSQSAAWHYDDAGAPTTILLCPATCTTVEADAGAEVKIVLGCTTHHDGEW